MVEYKKYTLDNGLTLLVVEDASTPLVSVNSLFGVGARDENPSRTGFAHLFEHLMFGGTANVPDYDKVVTKIGGDSNASTNNDFTQYHLTVPARFLETAFMLESDRMCNLDLSPRSLAVQQSVVTEEYNYRYLNRPYGDMWLHLRPLCYRVHPYRWCTIGADIAHVQEATLDDVASFYNRFYCPDNAIVAVVGNVKSDEVLRLAEKYYGNIPSGGKPQRCLPAEPRQTEPRSLSLNRDVPSNALYLAYHAPARLDPDLRAADLVSDILSNGRSSRLYNRLVKDKSLFTEIDAFITGDVDPGLFLVAGKLCDGVAFDAAIGAVEEELDSLSSDPLPHGELEKVQNRFESTFVYGYYKALDRAQLLCYYDWLGHIDWINNEPLLYRQVSEEDIHRVAAAMFHKDNQSTLLYNACGA